MSNTGGSWVPKDQQTATWRIWHRRYQCRHSSFHARSLEDIEHFGVPVSGDAEFDRTMMNESRIYYKTAEEMIELFRRDIPVGLMKPADAKAIYDDITDHLKLWELTALRSPNIKPDNKLLEDLMLMDRFAQAVYPHAVPYFTTEKTESLLMRRMTEVMVLPAATLNPDPKPVVPDGEEQGYQVPPRESLFDIFANRRELSNKSWRGG
jgi:hypothetical protein